MNSLAALLREGIGTADNIPDCEKTMDAAADDLDLLDAAVKELRVENERLRAALLDAAVCIETFCKHSERLRPYDNIADAESTADRCRILAAFGVAFEQKARED